MESTSQANHKKYRFQNRIVSFGKIKRERRNYQVQYYSGVVDFSNGGKTSFLINSFGYTTLKHSPYLAYPHPTKSQISDKMESFNKKIAFASMLLFLLFPTAAAEGIKGAKSSPPPSVIVERRLKKKEKIKGPEGRDCKSCKYQKGFMIRHENALERYLCVFQH